MKAVEWVLGFDVRCDALPGTWSEEQRNTFLIRRDVTRVVSADRLISPSLFDEADFVAAGPEAANLALFLWLDLQELRQRRATPAAVDYRLFAFTLRGDDMTVAEQEECAPFLWPTQPAHIVPSWKLLGFDVADLALLSGLTDCGYKPEEGDSLRERYGKSLNELHLFESPGEAASFRKLTNVRVPEHGPFFVVGVYEVVG